jgi:hypothetical protein
MKKILSILTVGVLFTLNACTELTEHPYSIITPGDYGTTDAQLETVIGRTYASLRGDSYGDGGNGYVFSEFLFFISSITSDEAVLPAYNNGADWWDGGRNAHLLWHTWDAQHAAILGAWRYAYNGIATANAAIYQLEKAPADESLKAQLTAEMRAVRAYYYYRLLDWFGNVPIITEYIDLSLPTNSSRKKVYEFVETELSEILNTLPTADPSHSRMTQNAAKCLLARLYLNAEVFSGTAQWQKCLDVCNTITGGWTNDYFQNFGVDNSQSPEIIFSIPMPNLGDWNEWLNLYGYDLMIFKGVQWTMMNESDLEIGAKGAYEDPYPDYPGDGNPICAQPGLYGSFDPADIRRESILSGQQYYADGVTPVYILTPEGDSECKAAPSSAASATPLVYSDAIAALDNRQPLEGSVWNKYRLPLDYTWDKVYVTGGSSFFDFVIFRYAEVLLMKAECLVRLPGRAGEAVSVLQPIRDRAGLGAINPTLENIEKEWKAEFILEDQRRTHMIRFGTFTQADHYRSGWEPVKDRGAHTTLFPIPYLELAKNNRLKQNPGYPGGVSSFD